MNQQIEELIYTELENQVNRSNNHKTTERNSLILVPQ